MKPPNVKLYTDLGNFNTELPRVELPSAQLQHHPFFAGAPTLVSSTSIKTDKKRRSLLFLTDTLALVLSLHFHIIEYHTRTGLASSRRKS